MKKFIAAVVILVLSLMMFGCAGETENFAPGSFTADGVDVKAVDIDVDNRKIEVSQSNDGKVHVDYFESEKEYYDISVSGDGVLTITTASSKEWTDYIGASASVDNRTLKLSLPNDIIQDISISTKNENITVFELRVIGGVELSVNSGDIVFEKLDVGNNIVLNVKNGDIAGSIIGGYDDYAIKCEIKKGECNLPELKEDGVKSLAVTVNNGDADIDFA